MQPQEGVKIELSSETNTMRVTVSRDMAPDITVILLEIYPMEMCHGKCYYQGPNAVIEVRLSKEQMSLLKHKAIYPALSLN